MKAIKKGLLLIAATALVACGGDSSGGGDAASTPVGDTTAPQLTETARVMFGRDTTPDYTFNSTEAGSLTYGGSCSSATTSAAVGDNTLTFNALAYGEFDDCTLQVTDAAGNASAVLAISRFAVAQKPLNDTGITLCGDYAYDDTASGYIGSDTHNNDVDCVNDASPAATATEQGFEIANGLDVVPAGQDVYFGRDSDPLTNDDADGRKGFSYSKVCNSGEQAGEGSCPADPALGSGVSEWACTLDNVTGLLWEVKTDDGGLRDKDNTYTWYNSSGINDGGNAGTADGGTCVGVSGCDTEKFVADVNAASLCGASDWRMPADTELLSITSIDRSNPAIDTDYFPNTVSIRYWTSSPYAGSSNFVWAVFFAFGEVSASSGNKDSSAPVRVVRGGY